MSESVSQFKERLAALSTEQLLYLQSLLKEYKQSAGDEHSATPPTKKERLTAYITVDPQHSEPPDPQSLQQFARDALPAYMVPSLFVLLPAMPRLANGKLDARQLPLPVIRQPARKADNEHFDPRFLTIADTLKELLDTGSISPEDNFLDLGGDSITAIKFVSRCREAGIPVDIKSVIGAGTLGDLITTLSSEDRSLAVLTPASGETPLTPVQYRFFAQQQPVPQHCNLAGLISMPAKLDAEQLKASIYRILSDYPALGSSFRLTTSGWQAIIPDSQPPAEIFSCLNCMNPDFESIATTLQQSFSLDDGWLIRFTLVIDSGSSDQKLLWVAHHLVIDQLSISFLIETLRKQYEGAHITAPQSISYRDWALRLQELTTASVPDQETTFAAPVITDQQTHEMFYQQDCISHDTLFNEFTTHSFTSTTCSALEAILIATVNALSDSLQRSYLKIDLSHDGRDLPGEDVYIAESIGRFADVYPCQFTRLHSENSADQIKHIKNILTSDNGKLKNYRLDFNSDSNIDHSDVLFTFFEAGQTDSYSDWHHQFFHWSSLRAPRNKRCHDIEINASLSADGLSINWQFPPAILPENSIATLQTSLYEELHKLVALEAPAYAPSDFPDLNLNQVELDDFLDNLE